jgi:DeoR family suf operon transcriptional repressor
MVTASFQDKNSPAWQIVEYLQRHHSATIKDLEQMLGVTTTAVRQHLRTLQLEGYIDRATVHSGVGRPHHEYVLTDAARGLFACHCDDLALTMLQEMFEMVGPDQVSTLLERVSSRLADRYADRVTSEVLSHRVEQMAGVLNQQGILTDVLAQDENTIILKTYNCPYHELAQEHREICEMDQDMLQRVLGSSVSLSACLMDGDGGCSFVVKRNGNSVTKEGVGMSAENPQFQAE